MACECMSNRNKNDLTDSFQAKRGLWEESVCANGEMRVKMKQ